MHFNEMVAPRQSKNSQNKHEYYEDDEHELTPKAKENLFGDRIRARTNFIAYSPYMQKQFEVQIGRKPLCIRPHAIYATHYHFAQVSQESNEKILGNEKLNPDVVSRNEVLFGEEKIFDAYNTYQTADASEHFYKDIKLSVSHEPNGIRSLQKLYQSSIQQIYYKPDLEQPRIFVSRLAGWSRLTSKVFIQLVNELTTEEFTRRERIRLNLGEIDPVDIPSPAKFDDENFSKDPENAEKQRRMLRFVFMGVASLDGFYDTYKFVTGNGLPWSYQWLHRYRAAVYYPWDLGMLAVNELYSVGVPLFIPGKKYMASFIWKMFQITDYGWWQARKLHYARIPYLPTEDTQLGKFTPELEKTVWWDETTSASDIEFWLGYADFNLWPYLTYFDSIADMVSKVYSADFDKTALAMARYNRVSLEWGKHLYRKAVNNMVLRNCVVEKR